MSAEPVVCPWCEGDGVVTPGDGLGPFKYDDLIHVAQLMATHCQVCDTGGCVEIADIIVSDYLQTRHAW